MFLSKLNTTTTQKNSKIHLERNFRAKSVDHFPAFRFNLSLRGTKQSHQTFGFAMTGFPL